MIQSSTEDLRRRDDMRSVMACLLDHYLTCYGGSKDVLAVLAEAFVPDWQSRAAEFNLAEAFRRERENNGTAKCYAKDGA